MSEVWVHSMHGVPWTPPKMKKAVESLRRRASISFSFEADKLSDLEKLDELVLAKRPDLTLTIHSLRDKGDYSEDLLDLLAGLKHVTALELHVKQKQDLQKLTALTNLEFLRIVSQKPVSLDFIRSFHKLEYLHLAGKFEDLSPIASCGSLNSLVLQCTVNQLDFVREIPLEALIIGDCQVNCDLDVLNTKTLRMLELSSIKKLEDVSFLSSFRYLEFLGLALPRVERLFDFSKLESLRELRLAHMKSLQDIAVLKHALHLELLELSEINTKLHAEEFGFLADMPNLKQLDFQFIDFNKNRIEAMRKHLTAAGKQHILIEHIPEEDRRRSMNLIHRSRMLGLD